MRMTSIEVQRYVDSAVRFAASRASAEPGRSLRVAATLVTCSVAVDVLNAIGVPGESPAAYEHINVHNPCSPLSYSQAGRWVCPEELKHHPVSGINWAGARLLCEHLGGRLPLAQEWERFASNNDPTRTYPWGDAPPTHLLANFGEHFGGPSRVGSFPPSELGLYDLAGNLSEWCHDSFSLASGHKTSFEKVVKGGAWSKDAHYLQIAMSRGKWKRLGTTTIGFRPVWDD